MATFTAEVEPGYDFDTFYWGALIFLAVFLVGFALWKFFEWLRDRTAHDEASPAQPESSKDAKGRAISQPDWDLNYVSLIGEGGPAGMTRREQEILFSKYAPRKVRKEMRQRLRAREQRERGA